MTGVHQEPLNPPLPLKSPVLPAFSNSVGPSDPPEGPPGGPIRPPPGGPPGNPRPGPRPPKGPPGNRPDSLGGATFHTTSPVFTSRAYRAAWVPGPKFR